MRNRSLASLLNLSFFLSRMSLMTLSFSLFVVIHIDDDQDELDSEDEDFMYPMQNPNIDTSRIDEIPAKEPKFNAVPLKSALKKKTSNPGTPTQDSNKTLQERQANSSFK